MSCRTTPAGSALTSFARIADGPGTQLSDVSTLSLFHSLRREFQNELTQVPSSFLAQRFQSEHGENWREMLEIETLRRRAGVEYASPGETPEDPRTMYLNALTQAEEEILADTTLTEARKASLLARIASAKEADTPDLSTIYALRKMRENVNEARTAQLELLSDYAAEMGVTREEALAKYREIESTVNRARDAGTDEYYTEDNRREARNAGIVDEAGAVRAYTLMQADIKAHRVAATADAPRLIDRYNEFESPVRTTNGAYELIAWGQDRLTGHTEFKVKNLETGEIEIKKYRIGPDLTGQMSGTATTWRNNRSEAVSAADYWLEDIANRGWYEYRTEEEASIASAARRCALCGQFANISHTCPDRFANAQRYVLNSRIGDYVRTSSQSVEYEMPGDNGTTRRGNFSVDLPLVNDYRRGFRETGIILLQNLTATGDWRDRTNESRGVSRHRSWIQVRGDLALIRQEDGTIQANTETLTCTCAQFQEERNCIHLNAVAAAAIKRTVAPQRSVSSMTAAEREALAIERQARIEEALASDWTRKDETLAEARKLFAKNSEVSYYDNFDEFKAVYNAAQAEKAANGKVSVPYLKENVLNGLATRETGQGFGVEIEYDFPETMTHAERSDADRKIGIALKEANITPTEAKQGYHAAAQRGYKDVHTDENGKGTWSWEHDGSVAGEIVTPTMYDEPETWEKLEKVTKILRENGAVPSTRTGAHIHVGTGAIFGSDTNKYTELARMYSQHEDVLYRLATDPERGTHRGIKTNFNYASPNPSVSPSGFADASAVKRWQGYRTRAVNLNTVYFEQDAHKSHVEFRLFDATLDAGVMQTQIKLAVGMTNAAARAVAEGGTTRNREKLGVHSDRTKARGRRRPTEEDIKEETTTFRSLIDTLFSRKSDKDQATVVFAATSWVKLTAAQKNRLVGR